MNQSAETAAASRGRGEAAVPSTREGPPRAGLIELSYRALVAERTTSLLVILLAGLVAVTAFVPQGREALDIAADASATTLHRFAALGLTHIFESAWLKAVGVLLAANLVGAVASRLLADRATPLLEVPARAPHAAELSASLPERAVEALRAEFRGVFGTPLHEEAQGSRVTLVFDTAPGGRAAQLATHLGLVVLVLGAGLAARPAENARGLAAAELAVKDLRTGKVGNFDMVQGEPFQFFQSPARYVIRGYTPHLESLGPAIRLEMSTERGVREDFWVFLHAPPGFDERHRRGEVGIRATRMGLQPPPGQGVGSSEGAILLMLGVGLLAYGALAGRRVPGRLWISADGDQISLKGVPYAREDRRFAAQFERWRGLATYALADE